MGFEPFVWLIQTASDPSQTRIAATRLAILVFSLGASLTSSVIREAPRRRELALIVVGLGLLARVFGVILGINHLGALALVFDFVGFCWLSNLSGRARHLSPSMLAAAASMCLPIDRPLFRFLGFPLQWAWRLSPWRNVGADPELLVESLLQCVFCVIIVAAFLHNPTPRAWRRQIPKKLWVGAFVFGLAAFLAAKKFAPPPVDRASAIAPPKLPVFVNGHTVEPQPLEAFERQFFDSVGGNAAKGRYGSMSLLVVVSDSPLRHLHSPTWCLSGTGHTVKLLGYYDRPYPTAVYRATTPAGASYLVENSFDSSHGDHVAEISEVIWLWLFDRTLVWRSVQRFSPIESPENQRQIVGAQVEAALGPVN